MTAIATKSSGDALTAANFNQIHTNVEDTTSGHDHDGTDSKSGIAESKVTFANSGGHTHTGAANTGTVLPEASTTFADTGGHDHSASGNKGTKVPEASVTFNGSGHAHTGTTAGAVIAYANLSGRPMVLMHAGQGRSTATIAEVDTHTFGAADFAANDVCIAKIQIAGEGGGADYSLGVDATAIGGATTNKANYEIELIISNDMVNANKLVGTYKEQISGATTTIGQVYANCGSHAITGAWVISLNAGKNGAATAGNWRWTVYKLSYG